METFYNIVNLAWSCKEWYRFYGLPVLRGNWLGKLDDVAEHSPMYVLQDCEQICKLDNEKHGFCIFFLGHLPCIYFSDIETISEIFNFNERHVSREIPLRTFAKIGGYQNIFMVETGRTWLRLRGMMKNHVYDKSARNTMFNQMQEIAREYVEKNIDVPELDLVSFFLSFTMDIVGKTVMGISNISSSSTVSNVITEVLQAAQDPRYIFGGDDELDKLKEKLQKMFRDYILIPNKETIMETECLLKKYLEMDNGNLFGSNIMTHGFVSLLAGHETTAMTAIFAVKLLAANPSTEQLLKNYIAQIPDDFDFEYLENHENAPALFLESLVLEVLRMYSPVSVIPRNAKADFVIKRPGPHIKCRADYDSLSIPPNTFHVKKGDIIFVSPRIIHYSEKYFKEPNTFDPARFIVNGKISVPSAFMAFGHPGSIRNCIGQLFARQELKIMLVELYRNHSIKIPYNDFEVSYIGTTRPKNPVAGTIYKN